VKCLNCGKRPAVKDKTLGYLHCTVCQKQEENFDKPKLGVEFTTESIKDQRREYKRDILQPFRDGVLSQEYLDEYGTQGIEVNKDQIKNAKYTYKDTPGWWNREKSKGGKHKNGGTKTS